MKQQTFSLVYTSSMLDGQDKKVFKDIALLSAGFNGENQITGLLLVYGGLIIQFLEGQESIIEALYARIEKDSRHKSPLVLSRRNIAEREFPGWAMGYQEVVTGEEPDCIFKLTPATLRIKTPTMISSVSETLLNTFGRTSALLPI